MMEKPKLHVVFGMSAAGSIREALENLNCHDRVIGLADDLSFGPIDTTDLRPRARWIEDVLGYESDDIIGMTEAFWKEVTSLDVSLIAWVCRNHAGEYSGFLEFVSRLAGASFRVIDASDIRLPQWTNQAKDLWSLGTISGAQINEAGLIHQSHALGALERDQYENLWSRLRKENQPLRVIDESGLVSAPITHFDQVIWACAADDWKSAAHLVGTTMARLIETPWRQCPRDMLLWSRVLALGKAGVLELEGRGLEMRDYRVRRPHRPLAQTL